MMKKVFFFSFFCLLCVWTSMAQVRGNEIRVLVSPDHTDWMYRLNEKCTFTVRILKAQNLLPDVKIDYELGPEMYPVETKKSVWLKNGELKLQGTMKTPGFFRCKVTAHVGSDIRRAGNSRIRSGTITTGNGITCRFQRLLGKYIGVCTKNSFKSADDFIARTLYGDRQCLSSQFPD